jgi:hypothetical protein
VILFLLVSALFSFHIWGRETTLNSPYRLAVELQSYSGQPQEWSIGIKPPMKYRHLFRWIVQFTAKLVPSLSADEAVYVCYIGWSLVFWWLSLVFFWEFTVLVGLTPVYSWAATVSLLLCSPSLQAYVRPVHTREDPLAYLFVILGLTFLFRREYGPMTVASIAGVLTRETTLIVPAIFLLYAPMGWARRLLWCLPPVVVGIGVRLLHGWESYPVLAQASRNWQMPVESLLFLFMTFGWMWPLSFLRRRQVRNSSLSTNNTEQLLAKSYLMALALILGSNLVGGRLCENRISFMLFPWVVPLAWMWIQKRRLEGKLDFRKLAIWVVAFHLLAFSLVLCLHFVPTTMSLIPQSVLGDMLSLSWLTLLSLNVAIVMAGWMASRRNDALV